jgi:hypothetical protein
MQHVTFHSYTYILIDLTGIMENNPYFNQEKKQIKIGLMEERILSMWEQAADYPVQFPNEEAKERFISDLKLLISTWLLVAKGVFIDTKGDM